MRLTLAIATLIAATGCSSPESAHQLPDAGSNTNPTDSGESTLPPESEHVWKPTSERLELSSFGFFDGSQGYDITRDQLSSEQLELLAGLRTMRRPDPPGYEDLVAYDLRISDRDGSASVYRATDMNLPEEGGDPAARTLDYDTLAPFLATFDCMTAKEYGPEPEEAPFDDRWAGAATFNSDPSCIHGVFVSFEQSHSYRRWKIDAPGTYRLSLVRCFQQMRLHLYAPTSQTELASSETATAPECPALVYHFDAPGVYLIDLEKSRDPAAEHDGAGDAQMRVSQE
jgi:hypothetical protein